MTNVITGCRQSSFSPAETTPVLRVTEAQLTALYQLFRESKNQGVLQEAFIVSDAYKAQCEYKLGAGCVLVLEFSPDCSWDRVSLEQDVSNTVCPVPVRIYTPDEAHDQLAESLGESVATEFSRLYAAREMTVVSPCVNRYPPLAVQSSFSAM